MGKFGAFFIVSCVCLGFSSGVIVDRLEPQRPFGNGEVLDSIFNIPITAIRQTSAAAQAIRPGSAQTIDSVVQIPITTLEAVGNLVKVSSQQRRQNADEIQKIRQARRDKIAEQRLHREEIQAQRLQQQQLKRFIKHHHKDPLGLNSLTNILTGHHGIFGGHNGLGLLGHQGLGNLIGNHGGHHGHSFGGIFNGLHGSHNNGNHGMHGIPSGGTNNDDHTYEVHEEVDEGDNTYTTSYGNPFKPRPTPASDRIQNKIAPKDKRQKPNRYPYQFTTIQNKIAPVSKRKNVEPEPPIENKVARRNDVVRFQ